MIKLSIVSPTWNCVARLQEHIRGVQCQEFRDIEHILVDNLSDDGTRDVIAAYQKEASHPVIHIREPDHGIYEATNRGIRQARGEWIHVLNSDNRYASATALRDVFQRNLDAYDVLACAETLVKREGEREVIYQMQPSYDTDLQGYRFPTQGLMIRRKFYETHGCYSERFKIVSDSIFKIQHFPKAKWVILDFPLVISPGGGISGTRSLANALENTAVHLFFHRYPMQRRLRAAASEIYQYLKFAARPFLVKPGR